MIFSSLVFISVFLPVVFLLHTILPSVQAKNILLIIASLFFYAYGEPVYILLMLGSTIINYLFGLAIGRSASDHRKFFLTFAVMINLGLLCVFKYAGMLFSTIGGITGLSLPAVNIALPIGISFYTFQALSYVIDVYREDVTAQKNYFNILLYISFFPQLISGPIVKYHDIEKQMKERRISAENVSKGIQRFIIGLSKKVLIANVLARAVDSLYALDKTQLNIISAWIAGIAYMLQLYFDFSGYSDMAIGMGHMFGFTFKENFNYPYAAISIKDFWTRWHISLSSWFKEYVYIPLGGNRKGRKRAWLNRWIVFFLTGLWHGANWTFVLWGLYNGFFLFAEDLLKEKKRKFKRWTSMLLTLLITCIGFSMFRADTVSQGFSMIAKMFSGWNFSNQFMKPAIAVCTPMFLCTLAAAVFGQFPLFVSIKRYLLAGKYKRIWGTAGMLICIVLLILCIFRLSGDTYNPFIYFRF